MLRRKYQSSRHCERTGCVIITFYSQKPLFSSLRRKPESRSSVETGYRIKTFRYDGRNKRQLRHSLEAKQSCRFVSKRRDCFVAKAPRNDTLRNISYSIALPALRHAGGLNPASRCVDVIQNPGFRLKPCRNDGRGVTSVIVY